MIGAHVECKEGHKFCYVPVVSQIIMLLDNRLHDYEQEIEHEYQKQIQSNYLHSYEDIIIKEAMLTDLVHRCTN